MLFNLQMVIAVISCSTYSIYILKLFYVFLVKYLGAVEMDSRVGHIDELVNLVLLLFALPIPDSQT